MAKNKEISKFPTNLYKKGGELTWGKGFKYSTVYVKDEDQYSDALKAGYIDSFQDALFGKEKVSKKESVLKEKTPFVEEDDF